MNVYELGRHSVGQFDITLALGLIYHLKHPILALENLYEVTKELLILETAIMPPERTPESFSHPLGETVMRLHPLAYVENPAGAKEQVYNWFLPGVETLQALIRNTGFDEVEVIEVKAERAILVCRKSLREGTPVDVLRHFIARVIVESGPRSATVSEEMVFRVRAENAGLASWPATGKAASGKGAITLGAHLLRHTEEELDWDYGRVKLDRDIAPGESAALEIVLRAPNEPGRYVIEFDMVVEHVSWFEDFGSGTTRHELDVN